MKQVNQGGRCKCRGCGQVFSGLSMFDAHQRTLREPPWVECLDPIMVTKKDGSPVFRHVDGVWKSAATDNRWAS